MHKSKFQKTDWICLAVYTVFFVTLCVTGSPMYLGDSMQHELQFVTREPIYALLIQILKFISIENAFNILIVIQALLAVIANTYFTCYIRRYFSIRDKWLLLIIPVQLSIHVMTPLASSTHMVLTNAIMTEGISYSCYLFYIACLLGMLAQKQPFGTKSIKTLVMALVLSLIRGQFMTLLLVWFIVAMFQSIFCQRTWVKHVGLAMICLILAFGIRGLTVKTYNYLEQGLFVNTASGQAMIVANVLYVADREAGEAIQDPELQALFYDMFDQAYEQKLNMDFAPKGLIRRAIYHEDCHEPLNFDIFSPLGKEYVTAHTGTTIGEYQLMMVELDEVASQLTKAIMPNVLKRYIINYVSVIALGFVRTVAFEHSILNWYALVVFMLALVILGLLIRKKREKEAGFLAVVLLLIVGNVTATSLMIECVSRYMLYNLPLFYIAALLAVISIVEKKRG